MEVKRNRDGSKITLVLSVGEAIALRDWLGLVGDRAGHVHGALETLIPDRLTVIPGGKVRRPPRKKR